MRPVPLEHALDAARFGGKAAALGRAMAAGLPVPGGVALDAETVALCARGDADARRCALAAFEQVGAARVAVRSSAIGEDGAAASFAGQHATRLGVASAEATLDAVADVESSGRSAGAMAYRAKLGLSSEVLVAVVVQRLIESECAGVLFTKNPMNGADERVVEAAWGLGEVVVSGLVVPDRYRMRRGGAVVERAAGDKDVALRVAAHGGAEHVRVAEALRERHCLDDTQLAALEALAHACEAAFEGPSDIEWAFAGGRLFLLQRRPVTR